MTQKLTILFDLDGTLVDTAPDLMGAHNHVMKKFGYPKKSLEDIKHIAGRGAWIMMQRTFRDEIKDEKLKQERLATDLLKKINLSQYFEYIAGCDTFEFNKPDPRHLTNVIEIIGGSINKSIMVGDSEVDSQSAQNAKIPFILVEEGYTEKNVSESPHKTLIKNFLNFEKIVKNYL